MPPRDGGERQKLLIDENMDEVAEAQLERPAGFWEAVKSRRESSDREALSDSAAFASRQRKKWVALIYGQVIALIAASVNVTSFTLENNFSVVAPLFQLWIMYIFLSMHLFFRKNQYRTTDPIYYIPLTCIRLKIPWYLYFLISCIDVGAGCIMLLSLQYTSLTSVTLLGSLTVPSTMLFSKIFLDKAFRLHHFLGVFFCLIGGCLTIWSDLEWEKSPEDEPSISTLFTMNIGDLMAISAALLYGLGDAVSEYSVKHVDRIEFLGMLGFFGFILTGLLFPFYEYDTLSTLFSDSRVNLDAILLMASYEALLMLYYVTEASFLVSSDATLLNLSLQAQNLWAILFSVLTHQSAPPFLFYLAVVLVGGGVFTYEGGPTSDRLVLMAQSDPIIVPLEDIELEGCEAVASGLNEEVTEEAAGATQTCGQGNRQYSSIQQNETLC